VILETALAKPSKLMRSATPALSPTVLPKSSWHSFLVKLLSIRHDLLHNFTKDLLSMVSYPPENDVNISLKQDTSVFAAWAELGGCWSGSLRRSPEEAALSPGVLGGGL
jgi:hypothetical protein